MTYGRRLGIGFASLNVLAAVAWYVQAAVVTYQTSSTMNQIADRMDREMGKSARPGAAVVDRYAMQAMYKALHDKAALPGEAARHNRALNVALVSLERAAGDDAGLMSVGLDVAGLGRAASLLVADGPVRWRLEGAQIAQRAKLALEGHAPVEVDGLKKGFLAGLRIRDFGAYDAIDTRALDIDKHHFCQSMAAWATFYSIGADDIDVWQIGLSGSTPQLQATDNGFSSAAGTISHVGTAAALCGSGRSR